MRSSCACHEHGGGGRREEPASLPRPWPAVDGYTPHQFLVTSAFSGSSPAVLNSDLFLLAPMGFQGGAAAQGLACACKPTVGHLCHGFLLLFLSKVCVCWCLVSGKCLGHTRSEELPVPRCLFSLIFLFSALSPFTVAPMEVGSGGQWGGSGEGPDWTKAPVFSLWKWPDTWF